MFLRLFFNSFQQIILQIRETIDSVAKQLPFGVNNQPAGYTSYQLTQQVSICKESVTTLSLSNLTCTPVNKFKEY